MDWWMNNPCTGTSGLNPLVRLSYHGVGRLLGLVDEVSDDVIPCVPGKICSCSTLLGEVDGQKREEGRRPVNFIVIV